MPEKEKYTCTYIESLTELTEAQIREHARRLGAYKNGPVSFSGGVYKYAFLTKNKCKRPDLKKRKNLLLQITRWRMDESTTINRNMDYVVYYHVPRRKSLEERESYIEKWEKAVLAFLGDKKAACVAEFTDANGNNTDVYKELRMAVLYASRKGMTLLISDLGELLLDSDFYDVVCEGSCEIEAIDFPLMCRRNLPMMRAIALYKDISKRK